MTDLTHLQDELNRIEDEGYVLIRAPRSYDRTVIAAKPNDDRRITLAIGRVSPTKKFNPMRVNLMTEEVKMLDLATLENALTERYKELYT